MIGHSARAADTTAVGAGVVVARLWSYDNASSTLIESRYGRRIAEIRQETGAVGASPTMARSLVVEVGRPLLKIVRRYLDTAGQMLEASVSFHPSRI